MTTFTQEQFNQRLAQVARTQAFEKFLEQVRRNRKAHQEVVVREAAAKAEQARAHQEQTNLLAHEQQQRATAEKVAQGGNQNLLTSIKELVEKAQGSAATAALADSPSPLTQEQQQAIKTYFSEIADFIYELIEQAVKDGRIGIENAEVHNEVFKEVLGSGDLDQQCELLYEAVKVGAEKIIRESSVGVNAETADSVLNQGVGAVEEIDEDQEETSEVFEHENQGSDVVSNEQHTASVVFAAAVGLPIVLANKYELQAKERSLPQKEITFFKKKIGEEDFSAKPSTQEFFQKVSQASTLRNHQLQGVVQSLVQQSREKQQAQEQSIKSLLGSSSSGQQRFAGLLGQFGFFPVPQAQAELTGEELKKLQREQTPAAWRTTPSPSRGF